MNKEQEAKILTVITKIHGVLVDVKSCLSNLDRDLDAQSPDMDILTSEIQELREMME